MSSPSRERDEPASAAAAAPVQTRPRLHISQLPARWNTAAASEHFAKIGTVIDCVVFQDVSSGRARYGFLEFAKQEEAERAIELWDGKAVDDAAQLCIKFAKPKGQAVSANAPEPVRLFVGNIGAGATESDVRGEFSRFGSLTECTLWPTMRGSGAAPHAQSAFVEFKSSSDAKQARDSMHLKPLLRGTEAESAAADPSFQLTPPLIVDFAKPKMDRGAPRGYEQRGGGYGAGGGYGSSRYEARGYGGGGGYDRDRYARDSYDRGGYGSSSSYSRYPPASYDYPPRDDYRRDERYEPRRYDERDRERDYRRRSRSRSPPPRRERSRSRSPRRDRR